MSIASPQKELDALSQIISRCEIGHCSSGMLAMTSVHPHPSSSADQPFVVALLMMCADPGSPWLEGTAYCCLGAVFTSRSAAIVGSS